MIELKVGVKFTIKEKITIKDTLRFWSGWTQATGDMSIIDRWALVNDIGLIDKWECEYFDHKTPLDELEDARAANAIMDVLARIMTHMLELRATQKK